MLQQHCSLRCGLSQARPALRLGRSRLCARAAAVVELPTTYKTVRMSIRPNQEV
jgi:hypothetical protein